MEAGEVYVAGLRFSVPALNQGQAIKYARLRLAAQGGEVASCVHLVIRGVAEDSPDAFSDERRPSGLPKTSAAVVWDTGRAWLSPGDKPALRYDSPNLASILNEIVSRPTWGQGNEGKTVILTLEGAGDPPGETDFLSFEDYSTEPDLRDEAVLEIFPTLADAFVAKPLLGRPTDTAVTINVVNLLNLDIYAQYGTAPGAYSDSIAPFLNATGGEPVDMVLTRLQPDTTYYYRIRYREPGDSAYFAGPEGEFHTQRAHGAGYDFTIQADSHLWPLINSGDLDGLRLYDCMLANVGADRPDFHISMGDFAHVESYAGRDVLNLTEAVGKYLGQRSYLDRVLCSIPFYLVLGNHEGEQGWRVADPGDSVALWGTTARKRVILNPVPDGFYRGDSLYSACCGQRGDYYAWEWGDALFVVLDPFFYTVTKPHSNDGSEGSEDPWDWTLGRVQYDWLHDTLHTSDARWKFVFIHHLVGGVRSGMPKTPYGRGGIEAAKYAVDGRGSYEWGGEGPRGVYAFGSKRPGWAHGPVHDMLVSEGVDIVFHGHDHVFVHQVLDGVVYQACPQPSDAGYGDGWYRDAFYRLGEKRNNSGHIRVRVRPDYVQVDYVRAVLPEDEPLMEGGAPIYNGQVSYSYSLGLAGSASGTITGNGPRLLGVGPIPSLRNIQVTLGLGEAQEVSLGIYDAQGRQVRLLFDGLLTEGLHRIQWDGITEDLRPAAPGVYFCRMEADRYIDTQKVVILR
jgi:hypothetical protein